MPKKTQNKTGKAKPSRTSKGNRINKGGKKRELTKEEKRHNAALKAWETRIKNGWVPKPRKPRKEVPVIEVSEKRTSKKLTSAQKAAQTRAKNKAEGKRGSKLTPGQKAAATRKKNKKKAEREARKNRK